MRLVAFYLPQYHPIPENDEWWGKGFTEWTNTAKAKPLFRGHYQPHVPADLGFYDLRVPETRIAQAEMAREYGIEGFCYYHYWFAGRRILERPFNEVLESGEPDFPFCICWANETWTGVWHGLDNKILIEQTYPGTEDYLAHFNYLLKAFRDKRYMTVDGKPILLIYKPFQIPDKKELAYYWKDLALKEGLKGLHLVGMNSPTDWIPQNDGFDGSVSPVFPERRPWVSRREPIKWLKNQYQIKARLPTIYPYHEILKTIFQKVDPALNKYPCVVPNWDNSPRSGANGLVLHGSTPELFRIQFKKAVELAADFTPENRFIFIKSWNEWAEGNHLEPDLKYGKSYLQVVKEFRV